jgi:hypothetical protein
MIFYILQCNSNILWNNIVSIIAISISIIALLINRKMAQNNLRLSIQQLIFKTISEKVKDCNLIWEKESTMENPNHKLISEIIISREIIDKSFDLFEKNYRSIRKIQTKFYKLFWTQLRTDIRVYIIKRTPEIAEKQNSDVYKKQIKDIRSWFVNF